MASRYRMQMGIALLSALAGLLPAYGGEPASSQSCRSRVAGKSSCGRWDVVESPSFRFYHHGKEAFARELAEHAELAREELQARWFQWTSHAQWRPACEVYLCSTPAEFERLSGCPAATFGLSNLEIGEGVVWRRQIQVRADKEQETRRVLDHELTHVVLADRFPTQQIPRWADEGIAVLSEPESRWPILATSIDEAKQAGDLLKIRTIVSSQYYPRTEESIALFYGQSASLVKWLVDARGTNVFLQFVEDSQRRGIDWSIRRHYGLHGLDSLEKKWLAEMKTPEQPVGEVQALPSLVYEEESGGPSLN